WENLFKENLKESPICNLSNSKHFRCKEIDCIQCCKLDKCNSYPCKYCEENNIECEYSIIKSEKEFKKFQNLGLTTYVGQFENNENGKTN
ncbi:22730_t:CDS:1, partial [Cetraspora pellucida]